MKKQVVIIGGGASGLIAGITAAGQDTEVVILEHMDRVGRKILSTGNGRCNMTNLKMRQECYHCSQKQFPMRVIDKFSVWDTLTFFDEIGIITKSKGGYIYPNSEQASAVLDSLRLEAEHRGVRLVCNCQVGNAKKIAKKKFVIETNYGSFQADSLILATGSQAAKATGSDGSGYLLAQGFGHSVLKPLPALVQLRCEGRHYKQLAGIRSEVTLKMQVDGKTVASEAGELQLTDYGISGIPVFQISRYASIALDDGKKVKVLIDYLPSKTMEESRRFIKARARQLPYRRCGDLLTGVLNKKLALVLLKLAGISAELPVSQVQPDQWEELSKQIKQFSATVTATNSFDQAQVCCGGVDTREVRPETLESRIVPGLYLVGELLDVDGICGGYNLQWAWSTGTIAGRCAGMSKR